MVLESELIGYRLVNHLLQEWYRGVRSLLLWPCRVIENCSLNVRRPYQISVLHDDMDLSRLLARPMF